MTATFVCRSNSHPFQERRVSLAEPVKIGRSVARAKPAANNAIFDCKVLSRNHALLWYEDGKFQIKDTKSSNGTFVNNHRLSKGSEESLPFEVNSGDIVQFGVDVVENSRRVTHGCIVSQIRLYHPNGEEAKQSDVSWTTHLMEKVPHNLVYPTIQSQDLYQLHQYLQEALHREQMLEQKLALLQRLVADSHEISEKGWQALIDEDKLLSRLEFLENQISTHTKTMTEEITQKELLQLQKEKHDYETTSKETLRQVLQEKLEAVGKLCNLERSFSVTEDECAHLREVLAKTQQDFMELAEKHQQHVTKSKKMSEKAQEAERNYTEEKKNLEQENENQLKSINEMKEMEEDLRKRLEQSQEEAIQAQKEMEELKYQLERLKNENGNIKDEKDLTKSETINNNLKEKLNNVIQTPDDIELNDITVSLNDKIEVVKTIEVCGSPPVQDRMNVVEIPLGNLNASPTEVNENNLSCEKEAENKIIDSLTQAAKYQEMEARVTELAEVVSKLQKSQANEEKRRKEAEERLSQLQEERDKERSMLHETTRELQAALSERENLLEREETLRSRIQESEKLLRACDSDSVSSSSEAEELAKNVDLDDDIACGSLTIAKAKLKELKKKLKDKESLLEAAESRKEDELNGNSQKVSEMENALQMSELRIKELEGKLKSLLEATEESENLKSQLEEARTLAKEQCRLYEAVQQELQLASESDLKQLKELEEQLLREREMSGEKLKEVEELRASSNQHQENYQKLLQVKSEIQSNLDKCLQEIENLKDSKEVAQLSSQNQQLVEEKESLLTDMKDLRQRLENQQKSIEDQLASSRKEINKEWEVKLEEKDSELSQKDAKVAEIMDEQQKLLCKMSEQSNPVCGVPRAIQVAILAIIIGFIYVMWPQLCEMTQR